MKGSAVAWLLAGVAALAGGCTNGDSNQAHRPESSVASEATEPTGQSSAAPSTGKKCSFRHAVVVSDLDLLRTEWNDCGATPDSPEVVEALHFSVRPANPRVVEVLLHLGASPDARDGDGRTPCMIAASPREEDSRDGQRARVAAIRLLLKAQADPDATDDDGNTCLHTAASADYNDIAAALLKAGADPNVKGDRQETPLMFAARSGSLRTARILLNNGADADLTSASGATALEIAVDLKWRALVELLEPVTK